MVQIYPNSADKEYEDIKGQIGSNLNPISAKNEDWDWFDISLQRSFFRPKRFSEGKMLEKVLLDAKVEKNVLILFIKIYIFNINT